MLLDMSKSTWCACWSLYCWWCSQGKGWGGL